MKPSQTPTDSSTLRQLQHHFQSWITGPNTAEPPAERDASIPSSDPTAWNVKSVITPSSTLSANERMLIYRRSYHARLLECMATIFPALKDALGKPLFDRFVIGYLQQFAPNSYSLNQLGNEFPAFLRQTQPAPAASPDDEEPWPEFIIGLAELEWCFYSLYDLPGWESRGLENSPAKLPLDPRALETRRVIPNPCLQLLSGAYPALAYRMAVLDRESPPLPAPKPSWVAVVRINYRVRGFELTKTQFETLRRLDGTRTVRQVLDQVADIHKNNDPGEPPGEDETILAWISELVSRNWFGTDDSC